MSVARMPNETVDIWAALAAPIPPVEIQWRQDGKPADRQGKFYARFVGFIDAQFVQSRFDAVVPGEWDLTLELLPTAVTADGEEVEPFSFKARLQVLGVIREDVGSGKNYKTASSDAFKRAAVRFGVGRELYALKPNWVPMDGDGKYAKPLEDPGAVYAKRHGWKQPDAPALTSYGPDTAYAPEPAKGAAASGTDDVGVSAKPSDDPSCPKCGGRMWDNRLTKRNPKAPDWKCRDRSCEGVIWPEKKGNTIPPRNDEPPERDDSEIPF